MSDDAALARMAKLRAMADSDAKNTFPRYALAMEHKGRAEPDEAIRLLRECIEIDPDYGYAFYHVAAIHRDEGRLDEARKTIEDGLAASKRKGDAKAENELLELKELVDRAIDAGG